MREAAFNVNKLAKLRGSKAPARKGSNVLDWQKSTVKEDAGKKTKKNRVWGDAPPPSKLDFTDPVDIGQGETRVDTALERGLSLMDKEDEDDRFKVEEPVVEAEDEEEEGSLGKKVPAKKSWFSSLVQRYV